MAATFSITAEQPLETFFISQLSSIVSSVASAASSVVPSIEAYGSAEFIEVATVTGSAGASLSSRISSAQSAPLSSRISSAKSASRYITTSSEPGTSSTPSMDTNAAPKELGSTRSISTGAIVGISMGGAIIVIILIASAFLLGRRRTHMHKPVEADLGYKAELDGNTTRPGKYVEADTEQEIVEVEAKHGVLELNTQQDAVELGAGPEHTNGQSNSRIDDSAVTRCSTDDDQCASTIHLPLDRSRLPP